MFNSNIFYEILNKIGVPLTPNSPPYLIMSCVTLFLAIICLISFVNIMFYFLAMYLLNHEKLLNVLPKWPFLLKLLKFYNSLRITFILLETGLFYLQ